MEQVKHTSMTRVLWTIGAFFGLLSMASLFACAPIAPNKLKVSSPYSVSQGMVVYYKFDETAVGTVTGGKDFLDSTENGFHATKSGTVTIGAAGESNKAIQIAGAGHVPVTTTEVFSSGVATVAFWMKWDGTNDVIPFGFNEYSVGLNGNEIFFQTNCGGDRFGGTGVAIYINTWIHIIAEMHESNVALNKLWIDGVSVPLSQTAGAPCVGKTHLQSTFAVGSWLNDTTHRFTGSLDSFAMWNRTLTSTELATLLTIQ